jgi:hypothetical protein
MSDLLKSVMLEIGTTRMIESTLRVVISLPVSVPLRRISKHRHSTAKDK